MGHIPTSGGRLRPVEETKTARRLNTIGAHLVGLVVVQIVLLVAMIAFGAREDFQKAKTHAKHQAATMADLAAQFVVEERESMVESLLQLPQIASSISIEEICQLGAEAPEDDSLRWFHSSIHLLEPDGSAACPTDVDQPNVSGEPWFKAALASPEPVSAGPLIDPITKKHAMIDAFALPGSVVVAYNTEFDSVGPALDYQFGKGPLPVRFVVTSKDRTFEIASSGAKTGRDTAGTAFARETKRDTFEDLDGVERIYEETTVPGEGWHLYAGISKADAFAAANESLRERLMLGVFILLLVVAAALVLARRFARPIRALVKGTQRFGSGGARTEVTPSGPAELRELGRSFNEMMKLRAQAEAALKKAYRAERKAADELREIDEMRTAFLRAISHELRTPLTSVVGYSTFLTEAMHELPEDEVEKSIAAIASQSKRLERLLLDLLDVERLERGIVEPFLVETDVTQLVMRVVEQSSGMERIRTDIKGRVKANIDPALVERIVENLVFNAIKHTPDDTKIWVRARRSNGHLKLSVEDTGHGVPDELKTAIFEPFTQGDVPAHSPGTGVGLNLVSQFAKLHGGRAWVEDRKGGGAAFRIELPADASESKPKPAQPAAFAR